MDRGSDQSQPEQNIKSQTARQPNNHPTQPAQQQQVSQQEQAGSYCSNCGEFVPSGNSFCKNCGEQLQPQDSTQQPNKLQKKTQPQTSGLPKKQPSQKSQQQSSQQPS